jgi:tripartite-type tricarboxylate transporter receptor subunit TctC
MNKRAFVGALAACCWMFGASAAWSQDYPTKAVTVMVAIPAGGSVDMVARVVSQKLSEELGQAFVVDNKGGASGQIGTAQVARSAPDGYMLMVAPAAFMATNKSVFKTLPYDPEADFVPISKLVNQSMVLVVRSDSKFAMVTDLVSAAKSKPRSLTFGSAGDGTPHHLAAVLFEQRANVQLLHVPYRGGAPAMNDLLGGTVDMVFAGLPEALPYIKAGKLRALGLLSEQRSSVANQIPTMEESGLKNMNLSAWMGLLAPAKTPAPIVERLNRAVQKILAGDAKARLAETGLEVAPTSSAEFKKIISDEIKLHAELVKSAGLVPQ